MTVPMKYVVLLLCVLLVGCVPAKVRESIEAGVARSRRAVELLDQGQATFAELSAYVRAEAADWEALQRAVDE